MKIYLLKLGFCRQLIDEMNNQMQKPKIKILRMLVCKCFP